MAQESGDLSWAEALATVTSTVADIFQLPTGVGRIQEGTKALLAAFDRDPLRFSSDPLLVASGEFVECHPKQL